MVGEAPSGSALLERAPDGPDLDDSLRLLLIDNREAPVTRLAETRAPFVLGSVVRFRIEREGVPCVITVDDGGEPLYTIPPAQRWELRAGEVIDVRLAL